MTNEYLSHYKEHNISPVRQNIADLQKHFYIRKKLYESLGLRKNDFCNKDILEIGPGGGFNAIYTASLKPHFYQLIEANPKGIEEIEQNFKALGFSQEHFKIENVFIENFHSTKKFDILICEGMLPCVKNHHHILEKMDTLLKDDGIMLLTCSDEISIFFDMARRLLANILLQREEADAFEKKVSLLVDAFGSHLDTLKGFGRLKEDWCADNLLGDALYNTSLSVSDVIELFEEKYSFYKLSPQLLVDPTWFKEVALTTKEYNQTKKRSFYNVWHNLMHYRVFDDKRWEQKETLLLRQLCSDFIQLTRKSETKHNKESISAIVQCLNSMQTLLKEQDGDSLIVDAIEELALFLQKDTINTKSISQDLVLFKSAFGRGQQYFTLIKES